MAKLATTLLSTSVSLAPVAVVMTCSRMRLTVQQVLDTQQKQKSSNKTLGIIFFCPVSLG